MYNNYILNKLYHENAEIWNIPFYNRLEMSLKENEGYLVTGIKIQIFKKVKLKFNAWNFNSYS